MLLALVGSAHIAVYLNIQGFVAMLPFVQREFSLTGAQAGLYTSFYFLSATIVAVFSGRIADQIGARMGLTLGVATVGAMMVLHALSPFYGLILLLAFLTGIGFSLVTPSVSKGIIEAVAAKHRAGAMGLVHGFGGVGALLGTAVMPLLGELYGWRVVLGGGAVIGLAIACLIRFSYHRLARNPHAEVDGAAAENDPDSTDAYLDAGAGSGLNGGIFKESAGPDPGTIRHDLGTLLRNRALLSICVIGITFGFSVASATGHMALFLTGDLGYSPAVGGLGLAWFHVGGILGQPSWGYINDRLFDGRRRRGLLLLAFLISAMSLFFGLVAAGGHLSLAGLFAACGLLGFLILGMPGLYFTTVSELVPASLTGLSTGVALVFTRLGVVIAAPLFGLLSDMTGDYRMSWIALAGSVFFIALSVLAVSRRRLFQARSSKPLFP